MEGKQSRKPLGESTGRRSSRPLELIHTDVGGSYTPATWDRKRFFVTFIYLMESKDEVHEFFKQYMAKAASYFGRNIARIRCDNGGEYSSKMFKSLCRVEGITIEATVPYTPELNA